MEVDLREFRAAYLAEVEEHLDAINAALLAVESGNRDGRASPRELRELMRLLHTIKGLSGMVGIDPIVGLAHRMESVLRGADGAGGVLSDRALEAMLSGTRAIEIRVRAETVVDLVLSLRAEINNGGFNQFFFNSSGDYAKETGPALHEVGLHDLATMYEQALAAFPGVPSADVGARRDQMTEVPAKTSALWRGLEDRLYADHDRDDRSDAALIAYLRKHGADF